MCPSLGDNKQEGLWDVWGDGGGIGEGLREVAEGASGEMEL